jgi:hypothetical protein
MKKASRWPYRHPQSRLNRASEAVFLAGLAALIAGGFFSGFFVLAGGALMLVGGIVAAKTDRRTPEEILRDMPDD